MRAGHSRVGRCVRTLGDGDASWQLVEQTTHWLIDGRVPLRTVVVECVCVVLEKDRTLLDRSEAAFVIQAGVDGFLLHVHFPSVLEVTVESVSGGVALREYEAASWCLVFDLIDSIIGLEEEMGEQDRVRRRTNAVVDVAEIGDMAVVGFVEFLTVP